MTKETEPGEWSPQAEARRRPVGGVAPVADLFAPRAPRSVAAVPYDDSPVNTRDPETERAWLIEHLGPNASRRLGMDSQGRDLNAMSPPTSSLAEYFAWRRAHPDTGGPVPEPAPVAAPIPPELSRLAAERIQDRSAAAYDAMHAPFEPPGAYKSVPRDQAYTGQFAKLGQQPPPAPLPMGPPQQPLQPQPTAEEKRSAAGAQLLTSSLGGMFHSDERVKDAVRSAPPAEQDATARSIKGITYNYDDAAQRDLGAPSDRRVGTTAQDLESTKLGAMAVHDTPEGKMVDRDQALGLALALVGRMGERIDALEGVKSKGAGDKMLSDSDRKDAIEAVGKDKVDATLRALASAAGDTPGWEPKHISALRAPRGAPAGGPGWDPGHYDYAQDRYVGGADTIMKPYSNEQTVHAELKNDIARAQARRNGSELPFGFDPSALVRDMGEPRAPVVSPGEPVNVDSSLPFPAAVRRPLPWTTPEAVQEREAEDWAERRKGS